MMESVETKVVGPPVCFVSYSHDSERHKDWVLKLATRLRNDGVDAILDRWDVQYGTDLPSFMEKGVTKATWFLAICTPAYVAKANEGKGGSGYEKIILTAALMRNVDEKRVIPIWRENPGKSLPTFVAARLAADFNNDDEYELGYAGVLRTLHGLEIIPKPHLGENPFKGSRRPGFDHVVSVQPSRYVNPNLSGTVTFDYSNNNGNFTIGAGEMLFETHWSGGGNSSIYVYTGRNIRTVAIADGVKNFDEIKDAREYDTSSSHRHPQTGDFVVLENPNGFFAAIHLQEIASRSHGRPADSVTFEYRVQPNRTPDISTAPG